MKDLGSAKCILGMEILRDRKVGKLWLSQERYIERMLERFNMKNSKPFFTPLAGHFKLNKRLCPSTEKEKCEMSIIPYLSVVGSLMYDMVCTLPDISHAIGVVSRFLENPDKAHWEVVKWIFRYLRGTSKVCLSFGGSEPSLEGYTNYDMAGDLDYRKSTSRYLFTFAGGVILWQSKLQKCVSLSITEAEYIAACGPRFSSRAFPLDGRDSFFFMLENHLKKRFGVATYFCFILKGKNKIRKKNPKCDS